MSSRKIRLTAAASTTLRLIPADFVDDGCSNSPDSLFGFDFRWACRIHDWWWCTRAHAEGLLTQSWRDAGDLFLKRNIRASLPRRWRWVGSIYRAVVNSKFGDSSYNSCGLWPHDATHNQFLRSLCRHNLPRPTWMLNSDFVRRLDRLADAYPEKRHHTMALRQIGLDSEAICAEFRRRERLKAAYQDARPAVAEAAGVPTEFLTEIFGPQQEDDLDARIDEALTQEVLWAISQPENSLHDAGLHDEKSATLASAPRQREIAIGPLASKPPPRWSPAHLEHIREPSGQVTLDGPCAFENLSKNSQDRIMQLVARAREWINSPEDDDDND